MSDAVESVLRKTPLFASLTGDETQALRRRVSSNTTTVARFSSARMMPAGCFSLSVEGSLQLGTQLRTVTLSAYHRARP
jgi:hypothetical protein